MGAFSSVDLTGHPTASPETRQGIAPSFFRRDQGKRAEKKEKVMPNKAKLTDADWTPVTDANKPKMHFFKVTVEMEVE